MAATVPGRPLGSFETALTLTGDHAPFAVVVAVRLEGVLSPERLRTALDSLQRELPPLRSRIETQRRGYRFVVDDAPPPVPVDVLPRRDDDHWQVVVEDELNRGLETACAPLLRCTLLAGDPDADLVLTFHHAIVDAASCDRLVNRLLAHATGSAEPREPMPTLPPAADDLFPAAHRGPGGAVRRLAFLARQLADEAAYRWRRRHLREPPIPAQGCCRILPLRLDAAGTAGLVQRARRRRVTLNAAVNAALLVATARHLPGPRAGPQRYVTFADLRPYLKPPPGERLGCYITMLRYTVDLPTEPAFWPLARRITGQVGAGAHRGDKYAASHFAPLVMRKALGDGDRRMSTTALSYSGPAHLERRHGAEPGGLAVRDLHAFISNFPLGPEYTAAARLLDDELRLDVLYLNCDMGATLARRVADTVLALLRGEEESEPDDGTEER